MIRAGFTYSTLSGLRRAERIAANREERKRRSGYYA